jgi:broad specificity phosphatase PhoE
MKPFVNITYFVHGTCVENERGIAIGWSPGHLSELGLRQSRELGELVRGRRFDAVYSSDLKRAVDTARIAFSGSPVILDKRLRELNYGDLNGADRTRVVPHLLEHVSKPFPSGESYTDVRDRMQDLLNDLLATHAGRRVAFVSHWAPQITLEVITKKKTWAQALREDWRAKEPKAWQAGWVYRYEG